jgi:hypothetical protein
MSKTGFDQELNLGAILKFGIGLSLLMVGCAAIVWLLSSAFRSLEEAKDPVPGGRQTLQKIPYAPPAPLLQPDPLQDIAILRAQEEEILTSYGWIDRDLGIARIPISRAIELSVVDDGMGDSE